MFSLIERKLRLNKKRRDAIKLWATALIGGTLFISPLFLGLADKIKYQREHNGQGSELQAWIESYKHYPILGACFFGMTSINLVQMLLAQAKAGPPGAGKPGHKTGAAPYYWKLFKHSVCALTFVGIALYFLWQSVLLFIYSVNYQLAG